MSSWRGKSMRRAERGFTLLEIIISLAIAALGIAAVAKATGGAATVTSETRERLTAVWVAGNQLSELRIARSWPAAGNYESAQSMGGRTWYLTQTVSNTEVADLRRVDIGVFTDPDHDNQEFELTGYIARFRTPEELGAVPGPSGQQEEEADDEGDTPLPGAEESPENEGQSEDDAGENT